MIKYLCLIAVSCLVGCAHSEISAYQTSEICRNPYSASVDSIAVDAIVYTDLHGDYLRIKSCPNHTVAIDFTNSDLYADDHADLLRQMRVNANHHKGSVEMVISGSYVGSDKVTHRATFVAKSVVSYKFSESSDIYH